MKIARSINLPFLGTGGRHSSAITLGYLDQGLSIDLSKLNSVKVNAKAGTLTIGGGTRFGQIVQPVYEAGYQMRQYFSKTSRETLAGLTRFQRSDPVLALGWWARPLVAVLAGGKDLTG